MTLQYANKNVKINQIRRINERNEKKITIYTMITLSISMTFRQIKIDATKTSKQYFYEKSIEMSNEYKNFVNVFSDKKIKTLFEHRFNDHVIKINDVNILFKFLYNLLIVKLKTLREYLNDQLTKK